MAVLNIRNPLKNRHFRVVIAGVHQLTIQEVEFPKITHQTATHYTFNNQVKTPVGTTIGDITMSLITPEETGNKWVWEWFSKAGNPSTGYAVPSIIRNEAIVIHLVSADGIVKESHFCYGCWLKEVDLGTLSRSSEENLITKVIMSVDGITTKIGEHTLL